MLDIVISYIWMRSSSYPPDSNEYEKSSFWLSAVSYDLVSRWTGMFLLYSETSYRFWEFYISRKRLLPLSTPPPRHFLLSPFKLKCKVKGLSISL